MIEAFPAIFNDIRPFTDIEIPAAMQRITLNGDFPALARYVYPNTPVDHVRAKFLAVNTIKDFQLSVMLDAQKIIQERTISEFSFSGAEHLDPDKAYLFVSNHRDIVLDALLLQLILHDVGRDTCQITFGENLMSHPLIVDIGKSNKMFKVARGGSMMAFYKSLSLVSKYIFFSLSHGESVWIAQRNGRTKNGLDSTDPALIKMFSMSGSHDDISNICSLNIVPVSISYEWEPCDFFKALELSHTINGKYEKKPNEDIRSILTGILQPKGRVHISICQPVSRVDFEQYLPKRDGDLFKWVSHLMDARIAEGYRLWPNSYIAHDLINHCDLYSPYYSSQQKRAFQSHIAHFNEHPEANDAALQYLLRIYSNPLTVAPHLL